jgi:hypothetical protein
MRLIQGSTREGWKVKRSILVYALLLQSADVLSYNPKTHSDMSSQAVAASVLSTMPKLESLGLRHMPVTSTQQPFPSSEGVRLSIQELVMFGSRWEDDRGAAQALAHFFNPISNSGLNVLGTIVGPTSPDWALEDNAAMSQPFTYKKARQYFFQALTSPNAGGTSDRPKYWGQTFQAMGHLVHHLQDMAQPAHVRNDLHCDHWACAIQPLWGFYNPSKYESWLAERPAPVSWYQGYASVFVEGTASEFTSPRKFWTTSVGSAGIGGNGIAEYTNRGFFSPGTNAGSSAFVRPAADLDQGTNYSLAALCAQAEAIGRSCPPGVAGSIRMFANPVTDTLRPSASRTNSYAAAYSIFDPDLKAMSLNAVYTQNRFVWDSAAEFLLPRAVAYSAGLIDYFFRGRLQISLPDEGVYAVGDHGSPSGSDPLTGGFGKVRLKLQNMTSAGVDGQGQPVIEQVLEGTAPTLVAVAKFHRNNCYQANLSGEYGVEGAPLSCRGAEEIVVSNSAPVPAGINTAAQHVTFTFETPIPISATDLFLQVVYRGPLGAEPDAVVAETKDISEPTYYPIFDRFEQFNWGSALEAKTWKQVFCDEHSPPLPYDQCKLDNANNYYLRFAPAPATYDSANAVATFQPLVTMANIPVSSYPRVAILTDTVPFHAYLLDMRTGTPSIGQTGPFTPARNQMEFSEQNPGGTLSRVPRYRQVDRPLGQPGVWVEDADYTDLTTTTLYLDYHDIPPITPLTPKPSTINFPPMP